MIQINIIIAFIIEAIKQHIVLLLFLFLIKIYNIRIGVGRRTRRNKYLQKNQSIKRKQTTQHK